MKKLPALLFLLSVFMAALAQAMPPGEVGFMALHRCVMENDAALCRSAITPGSYALFERFSSYKLMPCLPTDFTYAGEKPMGNHTLVKATMQAGGGKIYVLNLVFTPDAGALRLDVPESLRRGLGENWQNKIRLSEQLYLMMKQNMGDKLTCDDLNTLVEIRK